jgi:hypothetical protein
MIVEVTSTKEKYGRSEALVEGYLRTMQLDVDPNFYSYWARDVCDLLANARSIPQFQNGVWTAWIQSDIASGEPDAVQLTHESDELSVRASSDYAPHFVNNLPQSPLVTLTYRARRKPLPESTDISHPEWKVINEEARPTEMRFDLIWTGQSANPAI